MENMAMTTSAGIANTKTDPVRDYLATFDRLRARKRWTEQTVTFRFVALILGAVGLDIDFRSRTSGHGIRRQAHEVECFASAPNPRARRAPSLIRARLYRDRRDFIIQPGDSGKPEDCLVNPARQTEATKEMFRGSRIHFDGVLGSQIDVSQGRHGN